MRVRSRRGCTEDLSAISQLCASPLRFVISTGRGSTLATSRSVRCHFSFSLRENFVEVRSQFSAYEKSLGNEVSRKAWTFSKL